MNVCGNSIIIHVPLSRTNTKTHVTCDANQIVKCKYRSIDCPPTRVLWGHRESTPSPIVPLKNTILINFRPFILFCDVKSEMNNKRASEMRKVTLLI